MIGRLFDRSRLSADVIFMDATIMVSFSWMSPVLAYFNPGSGSLVLQAVVGGTAGLLVLGNYLWALVADRFRRRK